MKRIAWKAGVTWLGFPIAASCDQRRSGVPIGQGGNSDGGGTGTTGTPSTTTPTLN
jgi:hypothetical protein